MKPRQKVRVRAPEKYTEKSNKTVFQSNCLQKPHHRHYEMCTTGSPSVANLETAFAREARHGADSSSQSLTTCRVSKIEIGASTKLFISGANIPTGTSYIKMITYNGTCKSTKMCPHTNSLYRCPTHRCTGCSTSVSFIGVQDFDSRW